MKVEFVRFKTSDEVELQGWLTNVDGGSVAVHIHGMSGNGYENQFLDNLRETYTAKGISFFSIDTRGRGIISGFRQGKGTKQGGSCFELFEESAYDIEGAIEYLKSLGKTTFILEGHSLGCTKVVNYLMSQQPSDIAKVVLLAPTDMAGWANTEPKHHEYLAHAKELLAESKSEELVGAQCWLDKTPLSAQTYPTICEAGSTADIYGEREGGPLLGRIEIPMLIPYGTNDIGITQIDGTMEAWLERVNMIKNANTTIAVIDGAEHGFCGYEEDLAKAVGGFIG